MKCYLLSLLLLFLLAANCLAQTEDPPSIITDRPDETEAAVVVPQGYLQIETGTKYIWVSESQREFLYKNLLLRYGVLSWLELRLGQDFGRQELSLVGNELEEEGFYPLSLGAKVQLLQERELVPQLALLYQASLPNTGSRAFEQQEVEHAVRALFSYRLSESVDLGYNLGLRFPNEQDRVTTLYSFSFGFELTDRLSAFSEVYGFLERLQRNTHALDGGFMYLLRPNLQLDISAGAGLTEPADNAFVSAGLSWRIPR